MPFFKKCGEMRRKFFYALTAITAFPAKVHRIYRISYKIAPTNLNPGCAIDLQSQSFNPRKYQHLN